MNRDPVKLIIGLGFAGVLALMGLISFISLSQMNKITEQVSAVLVESNEKISATNAMRDSIRERGDTLHRMYLTDDYILRDELRLELAEHGLRYKNARDVLSTLPKSAREAKLIDDIVRQTRTAKTFNDNAAESLLSNLPLPEVQESLRLANLSRQEMLESLDILVALQEKNSRDIIKEAHQYQESISNIILFLCLAAFFIALYIAQLVLREASKKNSEIRFQATHDELTKLVNRKEFNHRLQTAYTTTLENRENHALCFLDLDKFKTVNDSCGHNAGDELLIQLTRLIKNNIRSHDTLARLGGDEFGLLLEGCSLDKAIEIAEGIVSLIKNYEFNWQDKKFHVGVSIGLVMVTPETQSVEKALSQADIACYAAKDMGRNQVHIHGLDEDGAKRRHKELSWVADINNRENEHRFSLYLQSIQNLRNDDSSPKYEVLLRLNNDEGTIISPGSYIPAAERFSLMKDVDIWVIENSFKHLARMYSTAPDRDVQLFINISANSLNDQQFADYVIDRYRTYGLPHDSICLEISEIKAIKNINQTADIIAALRKHNIKFALDNFGEGMAPFSSLKNLPVDYLKIDGNLIKNMSHNTADRAMVAGINQIGKVMNIRVIAQHVENVFTLNQLKEIGVDYAQGYHLDKPGPIDSHIEKMRPSSEQFTSSQS